VIGKPLPSCEEVGKWSLKGLKNQRLRGVGAVMVSEYWGQREGIFYNRDEDGRKYRGTVKGIRVKKDGRMGTHAK